jgi:hypothetical protein
MKTEIEQQRYTYYIPHFGRPIRVKDMPIEYIKKILWKIQTNQITENVNYSLPYLQYILEAELKIRPMLFTYIADKILKTTLTGSSNRNKEWTQQINSAIKDKVTNYYSKKLYYS